VAGEQFIWLVVKLRFTARPSNPGGGFKPHQISIIFSKKM